MVTAHPEGKDLVNLARERLGKKKTQRILDHCKRCPECAERLLAEVRDQPLAGERPKLSMWNWISIMILILALITAVAAMVWMLRNLAGPGQPDLDGDAEAFSQTVLTEIPDNWQEDAFTHAMVSNDGSRLLRVDSLGVSLIDTASGQSRRDELLLDLDQVMGARFDGGGGIARFANRRHDLGWFLERDSELRLSTLPPDASPEWAPGNAEVLWTRPPGNRIYLGAPPDHRGYPVDGRVLGLAWSPLGDAGYALTMSAGGISSLLRIGRISGDLEVVRAGLDASALPNGMAVSPDGNTIFLALASAEVPDPEARHDPAADRDLDLYEMDVRSGALRRIVASSGDDFWPLVAGDQLYWTRNRWRASVVLVSLRDNVPAAPIVVAGAALDQPDAQLPGWSPDGRLVAFTVGAWRLADWGLNLDAFAVPVDREGAAAGPAEPLVSGYHEDRTPAWSPDGRWLAYRSRRSQEPVPYYAGPGVADDIFLRRAAPGSDETRLTDFGWEVGSPDWSPDGRRLVFDTWDRQSVPRVSRPWIATLEPQTGKLVAIEPVSLPEGVSGSVSAVWSPVADELLLIERVDPGRQALWIAELAAAHADKVVDFASSTRGGADWTPDGAQIVYAASVGGRMQLFAVSRRGGEPRRLTDETVSLLHPSVSPDGRWVAATRLSQRKEVRRLPLRRLR